MSKICVKSLRTHNLVFIPVHMVTGVGTDESGKTYIDRVSSPRLRVYESVDRVQEMIQQAYGHKPATKQVNQTVRVNTTTVAVAPQRNRSDRIVDTALGVGMGIVGAEIVGETIDKIFDLDWF